MAVLLISHDLGVMSALADTLHVMYAGRIVESGPSARLLTAPRHPYTRSLLDSLPDPTARGTDLRVIRGEPPAPDDRRPPGCPFSPRCAFVEPRASRPFRRSTARRRPRRRLRRRPVRNVRRRARTSLEIRNLTVEYHRARVAVRAGRRRRRPRRPPRPGRRPRRRVRLRQVDARPGGDRARPAGVRHRVTSTASTSSRSAMAPGRRDCARSRWCSRIPTPRSTRAGASASRSPTGYPTAPATATARDVASLLEQVGLNGSIGTATRSSSPGGQRQRIAIARALAPDPEIIIADEAVSALDASTQAQVANLLVRLARQRDAGLLFISHDLGIVRHISDTVAVMYLGRIVEQGLTESVWEHPPTPTPGR